MRDALVRHAARQHGMASATPIQSISRNSSALAVAVREVPISRTPADEPEHAGVVSENGAKVRIAETGTPHRTYLLSWCSLAIPVFRQQALSRPETVRLYWVAIPTSTYLHKSAYFGLGAV